MEKIKLAVEKYKQLILDAERFIWAHAETGYKEFETSKYMEEAFEKLGYDLVKAENITGFYTVIDTNKPGPEVMILAELDSIICPEHKDANPITGAVHSCGHNAQCAALLGIAGALKEPDVLEGLCGRIRLCAVPAEELLEIEYRTELKNKGIIKYFGGKSEFLYRGYFDGVDIAFMVHTTTADTYSVKKGSVGFLAKMATYKGVASHAGGFPEKGINALYAANCGLNAVNAIRERFKESDIVRVHPIITNGGAMVNAIPEKAVIESYVRASTFEAIKNINQQVNQALCGAALSIGANIDIYDVPGYAPLVNDDNMIELSEKAAKLIVPEYGFNNIKGMGAGSTDMGDLSCVMPVVHPYACGAKGRSHGNDYEIVNPISACVDNAKFQLAILKLLLSDGAKEAKKVISEFVPMFKTKEEYFEFVDALGCSGDRINYSNVGEVTVNVR